MIASIRTCALLAMIGAAALVGIARAEEKPAAAPAAEAKPAADAAKPDAEGFVPLFNGKDLTGWEGNTDLWSVQDGAITGKTTAEKPLKGNTFLVLKTMEPSDFELRFQYKIVGGNSGVQYRSKLMDPKTFRVGGYQADFEAGKTYSGILYDEGGIAGGRQIMAKRGEKVTYPAEGEKKVEKLPMSSEELQAAIKNEDWNEYVIIAKGNHLIHKINGNTTIEVIDNSPKALTKGVLALQIHTGPPMTVQFKDIRIKSLAVLDLKSGE